MSEGCALSKMVGLSLELEDGSGVPEKINVARTMEDEIYVKKKVGNLWL